MDGLTANSDPPAFAMPPEGMLSEQADLTPFNLVLGPRTPRQSLIRTERGWAVMGQPTKGAETWFNGARDELAALFPHHGEDELNRAGSVMALQLAR